MSWLDFIPVIGPALNAAANLISGSQSAKASKEAAKLSYDAAQETNATNVQIQQDINQSNRELAEQQNLWNIEQWNRQNEYNSPANQRKLLKEAGLNPVLMSGGNFSPAESLQSADLANQQSTQIQNPQLQSAGLGLQGQLQAAETLKGIVSSSTDIFKKFIESRKLEVESGSIEQLTPKQVAKLESEVNYFNAHAYSIKQLTPKQVKEISARISNFRKQYILLDKDIQNKELLNDSIKLQNNLVKAQWDDLVQLPKAQVEVALATAFMQRAQGSKANFETSYMRKHGRTVPSNAIDQFLNLLFDGLDEFGVTPREIVDRLKSHFGFGSHDDDFKSMYLLGQSLFGVLKSVGTGSLDFLQGINDSFFYTLFPDFMGARKSNQKVDSSQFE